MDTSTILLALLPLIIISVALTLFCLVDLYRRRPNQVQGGNKWVWLAVILLVSTIGPIAYLLAGRVESNLE